VSREELQKMLRGDIRDALKGAFTKYNLEIKIKNLKKALEIASLLLEEVRNEDRVHDILYYVDVSFYIPVSPQKVFVMTYLYELYDDSFSFDIENNEENITFSYMSFFVNLFSFRYVEEPRLFEVERKEFEEKVKLVGEIFARNNINAQKISLSIPPVDGYEFVYPIEAEVFWFLV
jgi:hypothetical protein